MSGPTTCFLRHDFFIAGATFLSSAFAYSLLHFLLHHRKRLQIRHTQHATPLSTQACVWLIDSLFIPAYQLAPNKTSVIFFEASIDGHLLIFNVEDLFRLGQVSAHITLTNLDFFTTALHVVSLSEIRSGSRNQN